jgi:hypothetical protein
MLFAAGAVNGDPITLASRGATRYHVAVVAEASSAETFAAAELASYLTKIAQATFSVSHKTGGTFLLVCSQEHLPAISGEASFPSLSEEEYGVFVRGENVFLLGGSDDAVHYAVYHFLGELGCEWVAPDFEFYEGKSKRIPRTTELRYLPETDVVQRPVLKYRKLYVEEGRSHNASNLSRLIDWMPKARFNILVVPIDYEGHGKVKWDNWREQMIPQLQKRGITIEVGGHGYQNYLNAEMEGGRLFTVHPEWFGMDESGKRSPDPHRVFCTSNEDAVDYLHRNVLLYLDQHPEIGIFDFWPPDSERWCSCEQCQALGTAADRHALLVSETAEFLKRRKPGVRLECIAYSHYVAPPDKRTIDPSVLVDFCPIRQSFEYPIYSDSSENNRGYRDDLLAWRRRFAGDISIYSYYRKYAWRSLPNILPHYMQDDLVYYRSIGAKGISVYSEPGDWFTYGVNHYVLGHLAWNPDANVDSLITRYCAAIYGQGSDLAVSVYEKLENIVRHGCSIPHTSPKSAMQIDRFRETIDDCRKQVETLCSQGKVEETSARHLNRLDLMLQYAEKDLSLVRAKVLGASEEESDAIADGIKGFLDQHKADGVFVVKSL